MSRAGKRVYLIRMGLCGEVGSWCTSFGWVWNGEIENRCTPPGLIRLERWEVDVLHPYGFVWRGGKRVYLIRVGLCGEVGRWCISFGWVWHGEVENRCTSPGWVCLERWEVAVLHPGGFVLRGGKRVHIIRMGLSGEVGNGCTSFGWV